MNVLSLPCHPVLPLLSPQVEMYKGLLSRRLAGLPGGGLRSGSIVAVKDELQCFDVEIIITHQVPGGRGIRGCGRPGGGGREGE